MKKKINIIKKMKKIQIIFIVLFISIIYSESNDCSETFESSMKYYCENLNINTTHGCSYSNGKCDFNFKTCSSYSGSDETICKKIIPYSNTRKCIIQRSICTEVDKDCDDYDSESRSPSCSLLNPGTGKRCVLSGEQCKTHYNSCGDFTTGVDKTKCEKNIPSNSDNKCKWQSSACVEVPKECSDYSNTYYSNCESLTTSSTDKVCITNDLGRCEEQYKTCELYNTKETSKTETGCKSLKTVSSVTTYGITFDNTKVCDYSGTTCSTRDKTCEDITTGSYDCQHFTPKDTDKICIYSGSQCKSQYKTCELYNTKETSKTETGCKSLKTVSSDSTNGYITFDNSVVCDYSGTTCSTRDKTCEDITTGSYDCQRFIPKDTDKICIYSGSQCKSQYKTCELYNTKETSKTDAGCKSLQTVLSVSAYSGPSFDSTKVCDYSGTTCSTRDKKCSDITTEKECEGFQISDTDKICIYSGNQCKEQYKTCSFYNTKVTNKNKGDCEAIKIYNNGFDTSSECVFSNTDSTCSQVKKACSKFTTSSSCNSHTLDDTNKKCIFISNACVEQYKTCEIYEQQTTKDKDVCERILPYYTYGNYLDESSKCKYEDGHCVRKKKDCSEIDKDYCYGYDLDGDHMCILENDVCKSVYKSCSNYNNDPNKSAEGCKATKVYYPSSSSINYNYKCIYEENTCKQKQLTKCEDYESGQDGKYCTSISSSYKKCVFKNNKCETNYTSCPGDYGETVTEDVCKTIVPTTEYYKCVYENKKCIRKYKECSEYKGNSYDYCQNYCVASDTTNKKCFYEDNNCIEKYIYCSAYKGTNKKECESIIPYNSNNGYSLVNKHKCVLNTDNICEQVLKECSDAKTQTQCGYITPSDTNKKCVYKNDICQEQYIDCDAYNNNGKETVTQSKCESIILRDSNAYKCVFKGSNCIKEGIVCTDITKDNYKDICTGITANSLAKKCAYSNSACSEVNKSCLEITSSSATEEMCSAAPTSDSNKKTCAKKTEGSGCEEREKSSNFSLINKFKFSLFFIIIGLLF